MVKMPNLTELTKKMNLQGMLDNVKSALGNVSSVQKVPESAELAAKFAEIVSLMENLSDMNMQQVKAIANIKAKVHELDKDIQTIQAVAQGIADAQQSTTSTEHSESESVDIIETTSVKAKQPHKTAKIAKPEKKANQDK